MDEIRNPYLPGAGVQPPELTGRDVFLQRANVAIGRAVAKRPVKSFIAVGLRGVGKTVLLNRVKSIATEQGCKVALIEAHDDKALPRLIVPPVRSLLLELDRLGAVSEYVKTSLRALRSFIGSISIEYESITLNIDPIQGVADSGDLEIDLPDLFVSVGNAAKARKVVFVLILDEMQYLKEKEMSALVMAMHKVAQEELPIIFMGAGLPLLVGKMGESKSYAERLFEFPEVDALSFDDSCLALEEPARRQGVSFAPTALRYIYNSTQGYPYFLQEWAYVCWNRAPGPIITEKDVLDSNDEVIKRLDESFFRVRFDRLTPREKQYLRAMAQLGPGPHRSGDIAELFGVQNNKLGPCRSALISKGMIFSPSFGDTVLRSRFLTNT